jgi:hypothetical protein
LNSSDIRNRNSPPLEIQELPIGQLVPGEFLLETIAVERYKASINAGNEIEAPRVTPIEDMYYVQDGNHRIMAMKLLGFKSVKCRIQPHRPVTNVADYETDQFHRAVKNNYVGFTGIKMGSSAEKAKNYEDEEDDLFEQEVLNYLCTENGASDLEGGQDEEFFTDNRESNRR